MPGGLGSGTPVIQHGHFGEASGRGAGMVVECGQHFLQASADVAIDVTRRFLAHFGLMAHDPAWAAPGAARRFELLQTVRHQDAGVQVCPPVHRFRGIRKR